MSKYIKLFNTQAEYDAWAETYDEGYPVSAYILSENSINGVQYTPFLNAVVDENEFGYEAATTGLHIDSNVNWTITSPDWITPSINPGTCKADVELEIASNSESKNARSGNVVVTYNTTETVVFPFEQEGNPNAGVPGDEIWYTTTNGQQAQIEEWSIRAGDAQMINNTYSGGKGIIKFDRNLTGLESFDDGWPATITSISFSSNITMLGSEWGMGGLNCSELKSVVLPDGLESIGGQFFAGTQLTGVTIPDTVQTIGMDAFFGCLMTASDFVCPAALDPEGNNYWGAVLYDYVTEDGLAIKGNTVVKALDKTITTATIPSGVTVIGEEAFSGCSGLTSVDLSSVTSIGNQAFNNCRVLTSVGDLSSVTSFGDSAFYGCKKLNSVYMQSVTYIGMSGFYDCTGLTSVTINNTTPPTIGNNPFHSMGFPGVTYPIYVPASAVNTYKAAPGWSVYTSRIQAIQ